jgi:hypothetical protein
LAVIYTNLDKERASVVRNLSVSPTRDEGKIQNLPFRCTATSQAMLIQLPGPSELVCLQRNRRQRIGSRLELQ